MGGREAKKFFFQGDVVMRKLKSNKNSKSKLKISACYIVKNEAKTLPRSINSLKSAVDEIIVVDTGSTDDTIEVAKSYGAKVVETTWNDDFSTPRNLAIDSANGDWIIMIDADEYFNAELGMRNSKLREFLASTKVDAIFILRIDIDEDNNNQELNRDYYLRAFRNVEYLRFRGLIHENIENLNGGDFKYEMAGNDLTLYHTGYSSTKAESKLRRNLAIINSEIDKIGLQLRHNIALVDCYFALGEYDKVLHHAEEILKTNDRPITGLAIFYRKTLYAMRELKVPLDKMMKVLNEALSHFPNDKEFLIQHQLLSDFINKIAKR